MAISQVAFRALLASSVVVCASAVQAQAPSSQDLVGTWKVTMTSPQGSHPMTLVVTDTAGKLAGNVAGEMGTLPAAVETSETGVKILFTVDYQGSPLPIALTGKVANTEPWIRVSPAMVKANGRVTSGTQEGRLARHCL